MATQTRTARHLAAGVAAGLLVLFSATSVFAQQPVDTSFTVSASSTDLTMAFSSTSTVSIGSSTFSTSAGSVSGDMPDITVTDDRGDLVNTWALAVSGDGWTDGTNTVPASNGVVFVPLTNAAALATAGATNMTVSTCTCGADGSAIVGATNLGSSYNLATGVATTLPGTSTSTLVIDPNIYVTVPASTPASTYTNTVTFSLS